MDRLEKQRRYNILHHLKRLAWLGSESPTWACGTPVTKAEIKTYSDQSVGAIGQGCVGNQVDLSNAAYLKELDDFVPTKPEHLGLTSLRIFGELCTDCKNSCLPIKYQFF